MKTHVTSKTKIIPLIIQYQSKKDRTIIKERFYVGIHGHTEKYKVIKLPCTLEELDLYLSNYTSSEQKPHTYRERRTLNKLKLFKNTEYPLSGWYEHTYGSFITYDEMHNRLKYQCLTDTNIIEDLIIIPISDSEVEIDPEYPSIQKDMDICEFFKKIKESNQTGNTLFIVTRKTIIQTIPFYNSMLEFNEKNVVCNFNVYDKTVACDALHIILLHNSMIQQSDQKHANTCSKQYIDDIIHELFTPISFDVKWIHRLFEIIDVLGYFCFDDIYVEYVKDRIFSYCIVSFCEDIVNTYYTSDMVDMYHKIKKTHEDTSYILLRDEYIVITYNFIELFHKYLNVFSNAKYYGKQCHTFDEIRQKTEITSTMSDTSIIVEYSTEPGYNDETDYENGTNEWYHAHYNDTFCISIVNAFIIHKNKIYFIYMDRNKKKDDNIVNIKVMMFHIINEMTPDLMKDTSAHIHQSLRKKTITRNFENEARNCLPPYIGYEDRMTRFKFYDSKTYEISHAHAYMYNESKFLHGDMIVVY